MVTSLASLCVRSVHCRDFFFLNLIDCVSISLLIVDSGNLSVEPHELPTDSVVILFVHRHFRTS